MKRNESSSSASARERGGRYGPIRSSPYIRSTVRWDYAPDICKDFKETGFCTFGDWKPDQLEETKDYEVADKDKVEVSLSCAVCGSFSKNLVITKCNHHYCEKCVMDQYRKSRKCAVCTAKIDGNFSFASSRAGRSTMKRTSSKSVDKMFVPVQEDDISTPRSTLADRSRGTPRCPMDSSTDEDL